MWAEYTTSDQEQFNLNGSYCQQKWTCESEDASLRTCKCDAKCVIYSDCCYDANITNTDIAKPSYSVYLECEYIPEIHVETYIHIVRSCPYETLDEERKLCENINAGDITQKTPVHSDGVIFRNMYCAMCHRVNFEMFVPGIDCGWKHSYQGNYSVGTLLTLDECRVFYEAPDDVSKPRQCYPMANSCSNGDDDCENGPNNAVFTSSKIYKNAACARCNNESDSDLSCSSSHAKFLSKSKRKRISYSYRILFDLSAETGRSVSKHRSRVTDRSETDFSRKCDLGHVYDPFSKQCQQVECRPPFVYENGACVLQISIKHLNQTHQTKNSTRETTCVSFKTDINDVRIINGSQILVISTNQVYTEFHLSDSFAYICINQQKHPSVYNSLVTYSQEEGLLSLVGGILSVLFLFAAFVIYASYSKLQNIPGKNLLSLIASLFTAQFLFLFAPLLADTSPWCAVIAASIHYAFLASFFWMNVMSFDIFFTFSKGFQRSGEKGQSFKRFAYYSLYAWSVPFAIVILAVCLDKLTSSNFRPYYGDGVCWITNADALLVFFLVPIAVILGFNIAFFIVTAKNIYISEHNTAKILRRKESCKLFVYIKLSVVMGMTWVFGFIATGANGPVWWYLFIIFNSIQGIFIFISFVLTRKVRNLVVDRVRRFSTTSRSGSSTRSTNLIVTKRDHSKVGESLC